MALDQLNIMRVKLGQRFHVNVSLIGILVLALLLRLWGVKFGLPSLHDPDEPIFLMSAIKLLRDHTLNPGWFGHPGTTTIYVMALIDIMLVIGSKLTGLYPSVNAFTAAIYNDPGIVVLPGRLFIVLCGIACVYLTYRVGLRLFNRRVGFIAALLLAVNPLHVQYSQIIRTDVHATVFMLMCVLSSIAIAQHNRTADYVKAGILVALACGTKWPAATILACPIGAAWYYLHTGEVRIGKQMGNVALLIVTALVALFFVSPYIYLDYQTTLANLKGEASNEHLGGTGGGFWFNMIWYFREPFRASFGILGLILGIGGISWTTLKSGMARATLLLGFLAFLIAVSAQHLIWARWIVPLLPFIALFIAIMLNEVFKRVAPHINLSAANALLAVIVALIAIPMALTTRAETIERANDTRTLASNWLRHKIPAGSGVVMEHPAFDISKEPWALYFPAGDVGCVDARKYLAGKIRVSTITKWRGGRNLVDLGTVDRTLLETCRADYAIVSHYDRYTDAGRPYQYQIDTYKILFAGGRQMAIFQPKAGEIGGPVVRIYQLAKKTELAGPR
jgi:hypothetical protein